MTPNRWIGWFPIAGIISTFSRRGSSCFFSVCSSQYVLGGGFKPSFSVYFHPYLGKIIPLREEKFSEKSPWAHLKLNLRLQLAMYQVESESFHLSKVLTQLLKSFQVADSLAKIIDQAVVMCGFLFPSRKSLPFPQFNCHVNNTNHQAAHGNHHQHSIKNPSFNWHVNNPRYQAARGDHQQFLGSFQSGKSAVYETIIR